MIASLPSVDPDQDQGRSSEVIEAPALPLRVALVLPGLGRVRRGAETAFFEIAKGLASYSDLEVELFGSGKEGPDGPDSSPPAPLHRVPCLRRERFERWPRFPPFRNEYVCEEFTFAMGLGWSRVYDPRRFDAVLHCTYPFVNWYLGRAGGRRRPRRIFVTQNGDWMAQARNAEYRYFGCDGLVCTNPVYFERHREQYRSALIPNGIDPQRFRPRQPGEPEGLENLPGGPLPSGVPIALVASALIASKNVANTVRSISKTQDAFLLLAGDGPERESIASLASEVLPGRHRCLGALPRALMPALYRRTDVFLHLSQVEPSANVYLEAASSGLPSIVDNNPVTRSTLGEAAFYVDATNVDAVAEAITQALEPSVRDSLGRAARQRMLEGWTWDHQAARYRDFLFEICSES